MRRNSGVLFLIMLLANGRVAFSDHAESKKPRPQTAGSKNLSPSECDKSSFAKATGLTQHKVGEKNYTGEQPLFPLYEQKIDSRSETRGYSGGYYGGSYQTEVYDGYHYGLSPRISQNFSQLLSHALACKSKGEEDFLKALKEDLNSRQNSDFFHTRYSSRQQKFLTDRSEEKNPEISRDKQLLELLSTQIELLESLEQNSPELYQGLKEQIEKNTDPKDGYLSQKLQKAVLDIKSKLDRPHKSPDDFEKMAKLGSLISDSPILASLLPPDQSAYYRQLLKLGQSLTIAPQKDTKISETFEQHEPRLNKLLVDALGEKSAAAQFLAGQRKGKSESVQDRLAFWSNFDSKLEEDLKKLKSPEDRNRFRDRVMHGLSEISQGSNWTDKYPATTAHAQEALIRASGILEGGTEDPLASRKGPEEQALKGHYGTQIEHLKTALRQPRTEASQSLDVIFSKAESEFKITIPEEIKNKIRSMDPFLLGLFKDNLRGKDPGAAQAFKNFFLTGHSTALFNLKDNNIGGIIEGQIESLSRNSPLLKEFNSDEKQFLSHALSGSVNSGSIQSVEWQKHYSTVRNKLLQAIQPALSQVANPPQGFKHLSEDTKALLYTIEMLDSAGNLNVNPFAFWENRESSNFYETEQVAERLANEINFSRTHKTSSSQVEARLSNVTPAAQPHGFPSHARLAELNRMARGNEDSEHEDLKLLTDFISHNGKKTLTGAESDQLKTLAYTNNTPEDLAIALQARVPEVFKLTNTVANGLTGPVEDSAKRTDWESLNQKKNDLIKTELRKAKTDLIDRLHRTNPEDPERAKLIAAFQALHYIDGLGPEAFLSWLNSSEATALAQKAAVTQVAPQNLNQFLDQLDDLASADDKVSTEDKAQFEFAKHVEDSFLGLEKLRHALGSQDPRVRSLESSLKTNFPKDFDTASKKAQAKVENEEKKLAAAKTQLLNKYPGALKWNEEYQAFELDKDQSHITEQMLKDLSTQYPNFKIALRDNKTGTLSPHQDGKKALEDWIHDRSIDFFEKGLFVGENQWFPLNENTAVKFIRDKGETLRPILGDRKALEQQLLSHVQSTNDAQTNYHKAKETYGSFSHGAEGFFRGLGNFYLLGLVDGPEGSDSTKKLSDSYNKHRASVEGLRTFGQLGSDSNTAQQERVKQNNWTGLALKQEREQIQKYFDNAMLTHDIALFALSLPVGGLGGAAGKGTVTAAERIMLQKAGHFLGREAISIAEANAARQSIGALAKQLSTGTQAQMGFNQFSNMLIQSTKTTGLFSLPLAAGLAAEEYKFVKQRQEISEKVNQGKEWRKYPSEPHREEGKSEADFEKEWLEWYAESQFDRNQDGKPDFLQAELKAVATSAPDRARYAQGVLDTQRSFFMMGGVGQALPNSGMLTHIFGAQYLDQQMRILHGRGKPSQPSEEQTQMGALWDATKGTAHMIPGVVLQKLGMVILPPGLQKNFQLGKLSTNTRELVGMGGFTLGNQGTTAIAEGKLPNFSDVNTLAGIGMDLYIGRSMAQHANLKLAQEALKQLPRSNSRTLEGPGTKSNTSSQSSPKTIEEVAKNYGYEAVDLALLNMSPKQLAEAKSPELLDQASQYFKSRGAQLAEQIKTNPHAQKEPQQIFNEIQELRKAIGGTNYFRLSAEDRIQKQQTLSQLEEALTAKNFQSYPQAWAEQSQRARMEQSLNAHLNHVNSPQAQAKLKQLFTEVGAPELAESIIQAGKQAVPKTTQAGQNLARAYDAVDRWTGLPSSIYNLSSPSPEVQSQRANDILLKAYRDNASQPETQKRLGSFMFANNRSEAFGALRSGEIKTETDRVAARAYALNEMAKLGLVNRDSKGPVEKSMNEFVDFVTAHREARPNKTLKELWKDFESGGFTQQNPQTLPQPGRALPDKRTSQSSPSPKLPGSPASTPPSQESRLIEQITAGNNLLGKQSHLDHFRNFFKMHFKDEASWQRLGFKKNFKVGKDDATAVVAGIKALHVQGKLKYLGERSDPNYPNQGSYHWYQDAFGNLVRIRSSDNAISTIYEASNRNNSRIVSDSQQ